MGIGVDSPIYTWVFYSSQILFFGAEFTRALSQEKGAVLDPNAMKKDGSDTIKKNGE